MYKSILAILLVGLLSAPALAGPPPIGPGAQEYGWGVNCQDWQYEFGVYQDYGLHDGDIPEFCTGDIEGWTMFPRPDMGRIFMASGGIELWIELYASMTCYNIRWQFHRITDETVYIYFYVYGFVSTNSVIRVMVSRGNLIFIDDKFGPDYGDGDGMEIPVYYAGDYGPYVPGQSEPPILETQEEIEQMYDQFSPFEFFEVGPCDWWWAFIGYACIRYHTYEGYYRLVIDVCPVPYL
jgi:hypothetical protein